MKQFPCPCGSGFDSEWQYDARSIPLCRTCFVCHKRKMAGYRQDVLENPNYECDEPIEPEDLGEPEGGWAFYDENHPDWGKY